MEALQHKPIPSASALEWLEHFASDERPMRGGADAKRELQQHLQAFFEVLTASDRPMSPSPTPTAGGRCLPEPVRQERAALITRVSEMMYVVGQFSASPSLSDLWVRGQVRRFLASYSQLCNAQ